MEDFQLVFRMNDIVPHSRTASDAQDVDTGEMLLNLFNKVIQEVLNNIKQK